MRKTFSGFCYPRYIMKVFSEFASYRIFVHWQTNDTFLWNASNEKIRVYKTLSCWIGTPDWLVLDFIIYTRKNIVTLSDIQSYDLGVSVGKNVVCTTVTTNVPIYLLIDTFEEYTYILDFLMAQNIFLTGIVMSNCSDGVVEDSQKTLTWSEGYPCHERVTSKRFA